MNYIPPFDFLALLKFFWYVFTHGGWFFLLLLVLYMLYYLYKHEIQHQFVHNQDWVFLHVKGPKENLTSTLAVEQIFQQFHTLHAGLTFAQKNIEGAIQLWYSFEIISMGGKVSFIIRVPKARKTFVESAIYAEYPTAEISETEDYMKHMEYDPDKSEFDVFGTEFKLVEKQFLPIKTYKDFEHSSAEQQIIDPLSPIFEGMAKIEPHEFYGIQILAQPLQDEEWKEKADNYAKELTGEEPEHEMTIWKFLMKPFDAFAHFSLKKAIIESGSHGHEEKSNGPKNNWMSMTDVEKERVNLIQNKVGKSGFKVKIRHLYLAPKDKFDKNKRAMFIGAFRTFGSAQSNKLKPDVSKTWTGVDYIISPSLEEPYINWVVDHRKRMVFKGYKDRDIHIGLPGQIMNSEELATIYHWPLTVNTAITPAVEKIESKKAQAPANLPV